MGRILCDDSALRFAVYSGSPNDHTSQHIGPNTDAPLSARSHHPPTPHMQHETHHTPHTSQVLGWTPGDEDTNDYFATIRPIGFAVYFATHNTRHTTHHTHTHITGTCVDTKRRRYHRLFRDYSAHRFRRVFRISLMVVPYEVLEI